MTKKEFRGLWAVPLDMDARRKRIEQMQAMLDDAPVVVDTVQASSAAPAYGMHTVKITGIEASGRAERRTVLASCKMIWSSGTGSTKPIMRRLWR